MEVHSLAYVLHKRAYQNSSSIVNLFTATHGRVDVVAKGSVVKSGKSRFNLQNFQALNIQCRGKTDLLNLSQAEAVSQPVILQGKALFCALYVNELLKELLPKHDSVPAVFALYQQTLNAIEDAKDGTALEIALRCFELQLLDELGYGIAFEDADRSSALDDELSYRYIPEQGFVNADKLRGGFDGKVLNSLSAFDLSEPETRKQAKQLLRQVIAHHLGGKPLKSRELFVS